MTCKAAFRTEAIRRVNQDEPDSNRFQPGSGRPCQPSPGLLVHADHGSHYTRDAFLDHYYNTQRLHAALGYCTPL